MSPRRFDDLATALRRPFRWHILLIVCAFLAAGLIARAVAGIASREAAILAGAATIIAAISAYWVWFSRSRYAQGVEALGDHELLERRAWREATGAGMPRTRRGARRWLAAHPASEANAQRRLQLLLWTDDLVGAREALAAARPETSDERFLFEIQRATLALLEGRDPDLTAARSAAATLGSRTERRHARTCLAIVEARIAAAAGADPWPPILGARADLGTVAPTVTIGWLTARLTGVLAVAVALSIGLALLVR